MSRLEHLFSKEDLTAYIDGELDSNQASKLADHLLECPECSATVAHARQLSRQMAAWQIEDSPESIAERLMAECRLQSADRTPHGSRTTWWTRGRVWAYGLAATFAALILLFAVVTPSLLRSRQAANSGVREFNSPPIAASPAAADTPSGPMVIRTINLTMITKGFDAARSKIEDIVRQSQGYIDRLSVRGDTGSARALSATLRLPARQVDSGLTELKKLGQLAAESQNSSEITSQYVDLTARLSNARNSEQRLLGLMRERAGNLKEVIEMEREIASVRENIERMEAQRKDLDNKVQYATIQLELTEEYHAQLEPPAPSIRTQLRTAFTDGMQSAAETSMDIALFLLRYGPVLLIWFVAIGSLLVLLWRLRLRIL